MFSLFFLGKRLFNYTIIKTGGLEDIIGKKRFLIFYLASGIFASILFSVLSGYFGYGYFGENIFGSSKIIGVGASGAIFGLLGLLAIIMPKKKVFLIAGPLIALIIEAILSSFLSPAINGVLSLIISIYIIFSIFAMFNPKLSAFSIPLALSFWALPIVAIIPLILIDLIPGINLPIGNMAHLGGLIAGLVYGFYLKKRYPNKTNMIAQIFSK
jgi:membrane associated rhomboid family serine protease